MRKYGKSFLLAVLLLLLFALSACSPLQTGSDSVTEAEKPIDITTLLTERVTNDDEGETETIEETPYTTEPMAETPAPAAPADSVSLYSPVVEAAIDSLAFEYGGSIPSAMLYDIDDDGVQELIMMFDCWYDPDEGLQSDLARYGNVEYIWRYDETRQFNTVINLFSVFDLQNGEIVCRALQVRDGYSAGGPLVLAGVARYLGDAYVVARFEQGDGDIRYETYTLYCPENMAKAVEYHQDTIYGYQDDNGNWHTYDSPEEMPKSCTMNGEECSPEEYDAFVGALEYVDIIGYELSSYEQFIKSGKTLSDMLAYIDDSYETRAPWSEPYEDFVVNKRFNDYGLDDIEEENDADLILYKIEYSLWDMDRNGVPELIMTNGNTAEGFATNHIFTFEDGEIRYLGNAGQRHGSFEFLKDGDLYPGLFWGYGTWGYTPALYYYLDAGELVEEVIQIMSEGEIVEQTDNYELLDAYLHTETMTLPSYSRDKIIQMGWRVFVNEFETIKEFINGE